MFHKPIQISILLLFITSFPQFSWAEEHSVHNSREEFIQTLKQWKTDPFEGTDKELILHLVGKPDDILRSGQDGVQPWTMVKEFWCYGTDRHKGFATLGKICFSKDEEILEIHGVEGKPPSVETISEAELRRLLRIIYDGVSMNNYDPFTMVRVVNTLHAAGQTNTHVAMMEYLRITSPSYDRERERMLFLLQLLYDVPEEPGYFESLSLGWPKPSAPKDPALLPRFPMWVYQGIPFLIAGYNRAGSIGPLEPKVGKFRRYHFRKQPLKPTNDPLALLKVIDKLPQLNFDDGNSPPITKKYIDHRKWLVRSQLLLRFAPEANLSGDFQLSDYEELSKKKLRWNPKENKYEKVE